MKRLCAGLVLAGLIHKIDNIFPPPLNPARYRPRALLNSSIVFKVLVLGQLQLRKGIRND